MEKKSVQIKIAAAGSALILMVGGFIFYKMYENHQANLLVIEQCFEHFDEEDVNMTKESSWSKIQCENLEGKDASE